MKPLSANQRRLAAILCADVASYARLMSVDEIGTLDLLHSRREIMERQIKQHGGRTANTAGDSVVAEFSSALDAVRCAIEVQERIEAVNEDVPTDRRVIFRVGVHVGEVMIRNGDIFGEGVNIAARMEKIAPPGLVCLSEAAYDYVRKVLPAIFDDLGPQIIKNLSTPIRTYITRASSDALLHELEPVHRHNEFNLGRRFHKILAAALTDLTGPERLTAMEPSVLASLHDAPGIAVRQLAERIGVDRASMRRMVKHLELTGWVSRVPGLSGRLDLFSLTPEGIELNARLHPAMNAVRDRVMASLSQSDRETLRQLLGRVVRANEPRQRRFRAAGPG
jgi:class 3 adenylate cyclase/DNA-binding MarR family transcriptional regulator